MALEGEVGCLELERGAELVEALDIGLVEPGDRGTAIRLDLDETLDGKLAERSSQRYSAFVPSGLVTSKCTHECGFTKSIFVTTPDSVMSSSIAKLPKP